MSRLILFLALAVALAGQTPDPAYAPLEKAYEALRAKDYDHAIEAFQQAIAITPDRPAIRKDLAYVLLKIGDTVGARDQFAEAMGLDSRDADVALEYAFLCYETKEPAIARRVFDRLRKIGNSTAADAFERIDRPLREGIARWTRVLESSPENFSAHEELAHLAEQRDEFSLAAEHYEKAWRLRSDLRALLLDLGRVWQAENRVEEANAALLAASRSAEPRVAEAAQELLPQRYPYIYEFQKALDLDPSNVELRRELAYLYLAMDNHAQAEQQFQIVAGEAPDDLLSVAQLGFLQLNRGDSAGAKPLFDKVLAGSDKDLADRVRAALHSSQTSLQARPEELRVPEADNVKQLAEKSLEKGYLKDALKYLTIAQENDPLDFNVMLKLGWTYNNLKDDEEAVRWFNLARRSPDASTAAEASRAYRNLNKARERWRTTVWMFPMFSTRWHDVFAYAQAKTELRLPHWFVHPYLSLRFVGDSQGAISLTGTIGPQYLSERSAILALGLATVPWHGITGWFEAGESLRYDQISNGSGMLIPDYRGGIAYAKGFGGLLTHGAHGLFAETNDDGLYVSRFSKDKLLYSQNRTGYTFREAEAGGALHAQLFWNWNVTVDAERQYWANFVETGPGIRFRFEGMPSLMFSVSALRGAYLINQGNPRGPNFNDLRVGIWYAFSR